MLGHVNQVLSGYVSLGQVGPR